MKPFSYVAPTTLKEAYGVLAKADSPGKVRAIVGGTDLIDQVRSNRRTPSIVMDIKRIPEMNRLDWLPEDGLHLGAAVSCTDTAAFAAVKENYLALQEACLLIGSIQIQNRASVAGNICNSAPSADVVPGMMVHDARVVVVGPRGRREVALDEFFIRFACSPITVTPLETDRTAPLSVYSKDWNKMSKEYKKRANWRCERCGRDFGGRKTKFLQAHHKNGNTFDNRPSNIEVLCIICHSKEPYHGQLKGFPLYKEYEEISFDEE